MDKSNWINQIGTIGILSGLFIVRYTSLAQIEPLMPRLVEIFKKISKNESLKVDAYFTKYEQYKMQKVIVPVFYSGLSLAVLGLILKKISK